MAQSDIHFNSVNQLLEWRR